MGRIFFLIFCLFLSACGGGGRASPESREPGPEASTPEELRFLPGADDASYSLRLEEAARIAAFMDERLLASQVLIAGLDGNSGLSAAMAALLREVPPGGLMLFKYNLNTGKDAVRSFLALCSNLVSEASGIAPFIAVDHEGGLVHRFGPGVKKLPPAFSFWELAQKEGPGAALEVLDREVSASAGEIRDLGVTMNFAPVAEVLNGDNLNFLQTRSYGPDPVFTEEAASAFVRAMDAAGIACVVKHFPGNTGRDPHGGPALLEADRAALDSMTEPFAGIIRSLRPPAIMVSHVTVPAVDGGKNASLSSLVMNDWLRKDLGFPGILIADDFSMGAVASSGLSPEKAAAEALIAGADMVMAWPGDLVLVRREILRALEEGRLPRRRLREAAQRVIAEKIRYGLVQPAAAGGR
ncbi:MAG: glycoside hydrolase family 3 protein [Treponema sp.]|jgi:beta-N-acetylhexosaminidase|nr:glycoside hydrolase family 3 protein [Treponema sp.]